MKLTIKIIAIAAAMIVALAFTLILPIYLADKLNSTNYLWLYLATLPIGGGMLQGIEDAARPCAS